MSKEQNNVKEENVVINNEEVAGINKENLVSRSKGFAKKHLPKVGYVAAGFALGYVVAKRQELLTDIAESELVESVTELGE